MNKKRPWHLVLGMLLFCGTAFGAEVLPPVKVVSTDYPGLSYPVTGPVFKLPRVWRYQNGDNAEYAAKDFDHSNWKSTEVGKAEAGAGWRWYRIAFELPAELENRNLLFDLGKVSAYDEVFLNGIQVGQFGSPPPNVIYGASDIWRKYPIAAERFRRGRNVLAIRVSMGGKGGLYQGPYTLQALTGNGIVGKMRLKTSGPHSLETQLTESPYLNTFSPGAKLLVGPDLLNLFSSSVHGKLTAELVNAQNQAIGQDTVALPLKKQEWSRALFHFKAPRKTGTYSCRLSYVVDGKTFWNEKLTFHVKPQQPLKFEPPVDASLLQMQDEALPVEVSSIATGHFGPRDITPDLVLHDDFKTNDSRSGMAYSIQVSKESGAPQLFLANTRPVPENAPHVEYFHRPPGAVYDTLTDAWMYGYVRPNRAGSLENIRVKHTSWTKRTYRYEYESKDWMDFSISAISPAWQATSNTKKLRVFEGIGKYGIGLPTFLAYESEGRVKVVDAKTGIRGSDMSANWILAWFNGGKNWNEFDTPYLFVLQNRPERVRTYMDSALFFEYPTEAGSVQGMPLYGITLQEPEQTASWANGLPAAVQERCRYWSRVLVQAPDEVKRTARVDYNNDQLTVKDEFTFLDIRDDWQTKGLRIAPISPVLALTVSSGNVDIAVSKPTKDLHLATLQGPLVVAENTEEVLFRVKGALRYVREVRDVKRADDSKIRPVQAELNRLVARGLQEELEHHPWKDTIVDGKLLPEFQQRSYTNLILALPYLDPVLRGKVEKEIKAETERYFFYADVPDKDLSPKLLPQLRNRPLVAVITNPVTGLKLGMAPTWETKFGTDRVYGSTLNVYMAWLYADTFNRYDWIRQKYPVLKNYFNTARNSHDWEISCSWDTFSGLRIGNGLQEGGGIYAGMIGMARIAKALGDQTTSDTAAYYAVMQLVGLQGQLSASDFLKERRPWLASNTKHADMEYTRKARPYHYAEFNEFAGLSQSVILSRSLFNNPRSYILSPLPEVMRLYQEVWQDFTNDFYDPAYDAATGQGRKAEERVVLDAFVTMDTFVYQTTRYPQSVEQVFDTRRKLEIEWWNKLADLRAYLDSRGEIGYRKLW